MPKIFALRHQLAEQQAKLKARQEKGSSGDSPTSCGSDEDKLQQGPSSSSVEVGNCGSNCDNSSNVTSLKQHFAQNYIVQRSEHVTKECEKSVCENNGGDNKNKDEQNAPLELIHRQRSTGMYQMNLQSMHNFFMILHHDAFFHHLAYFSIKMHNQKNIQHLVRAK